MAVTTAREVFDSFEATFQDKSEIPAGLEMLWLKKAVAQYSTEVEEIRFDEELQVFAEQLDQYVIDVLAQYMKVYYMEREVSKVNKRVSIVSKDISIDGNNGSKTAAKNELDYNDIKANMMTANQKTPAYN
jgi:hypothetical protein